MQSLQISVGVVPLVFLVHVAQFASVHEEQALLELTKYLGAHVVQLLAAEQTKQFEEQAVQVGAVKT